MHLEPQVVVPCAPYQHTRVPYKGYGHCEKQLPVIRFSWEIPLGNLEVYFLAAGYLLYWSFQSSSSHCRWSMFGCNQSPAAGSFGFTCSVLNSVSFDGI